LSGLETLPIDESDAVDRIVKAVANNFVAAQRDELDAVQSAASAVLSAIEPLATKQDVDDALAQFERTLTPPHRASSSSLAASTRPSAVCFIS
jgi:hypothetical protein